MPPAGRAEVYEIRRTFSIPTEFAFRWCTDYTPEDGKLSKGGHSRQALRRSSRAVVYEDPYPSPHAWMWSRQIVTLHPPNRGTAVAEGNYRHWEVAYSVRSLGKERTEFTMLGLRRPQIFGEKNPSRRVLNAELHRMWKNYGIAMEREYRAAHRRRQH